MYRKAAFRNNYLLILVIVTIFNLTILYIRNRVVGNDIYHFLVWNLFLAIVPMVFAWLSYLALHKINTAVVVAITLVWLFFYPNSPYMISDLIHTDTTSRFVIYDSLILFSFAILALYYGFYSLKIIHRVYKILAGPRVATSLVGLFIILSSAGIYLGRILRLNSWDLFTRPLYVFRMVVDHLFPVTKNPVTYAIIFLFSVIQFILLILAKDLDEIKKENLISGEPLVPEPAGFRHNPAV